MNMHEAHFEIIVRVEADERTPGLHETAERVRSLVGAQGSGGRDELLIEHWEPRPVRGPVTRAFLTSVGLVSVTRASLAGFAGVLNELVAAFDGTTAAETVTIEVGDQVIPLSEVTPAMIESWLPTAV